MTDYARKKAKSYQYIHSLSYLYSLLLKKKKGNKNNIVMLKK
jgi:hypothetical protein